MRRLGPRRHKAAFRTGAGGAVADGENIRIAGSLQRRLDHQLIDTVGFEAADLFHEIWRFDPGRPDHQIRFNIFAIFGVQTACIRAGDHGLRQHPYAQLGQLIMRRPGNARRQCGQNTLARLDQRDVQRFVSQPFVAVAVQLFHRIMQFSGELHAGGAAADNGDVHFTVGTQVGGVFEEQVEHFLMETTRLMRVVEENAVLFHARGVEVIRGTAQRHHQRVVRQFTLSHQQLAFFIAQLAEGDGFPFAVDINHRAQLELETVVAGMGQIAQRIDTFIQRTGRHFMQQRLPQMAVVTVHQGDFRFLMAP